MTLTTQQANRAPVVTTYNRTVKRGQSITSSFTVTDADGDTITRYAIYDGNTNSNSGYFTLNGVKQSAGQVIYLNANQLSGLKFVGGSTATSDNLFIAASDGKTWSNWSQHKVTTEAGSAPTVSIQNATVNANTAMSLNFTTSDKDGDKVTRYEFFDSNAQATSGYFTVNGVRQAAGRGFFVDADKLHTVKFVGGAAASTDRISVRATDGIDGWGALSYVNFTTQAPVTNDWFDLNIKDTTIRALARERFQDGIFSRQEMIDIFDSAKDGGIVDTNEFADLKLLSSDVTYIKMADHARVLSQKIAHGNKANQKYIGQSLGNLYAGSSADHLQKLIDEHFFGKDLPLAKGEYAYGEANEATYKYVQGQLFQNGIQYTDVRQGFLGDCYYLAALAGIALADSNKIKDMFIDNRDETYTVRFFNNGQTDYVTVNRFLPTEPNGTLSFARAGNFWNTYTNSSNELWVALAEKAYAQINEAGWIGQDGTNSYKGIEGGGAQVAAEQVARLKGSYHGFDNWTVADAISAFASGAIVFFSSRSEQHKAQIGSKKLVGGHAYLLKSYDTVKRTVTLFNPHNSGNSYDGDGYLTVSWNDIPQYFYAWRKAV
ncbi:putative Peptidase domain protein [Planktothrix serta PCC 8927]|uniref:Peptidase domain protein n=1 Tax=Planktothrix serta PCC 8927 TaxID=671068 RepID=A0A7Z9BL43_9CYAN|nr:C2 family cysteine protease [Planktothrix serta]VXD14932.1 putative Peptidase domain protein [Planktothrix serta PCC 8927]